MTRHAGDREEAAASFELLGSPFRLGTLMLPNRIVMSPMSSGLGSPDGTVSEAQIAYYGERADGGVGLIIVEFTAVDRSRGLAELNQLSLDERSLDGHQALVRRIRSAGGHAALQLHAPGRYVNRTTLAGLPAAPSALSKRDGSPLARALEEDEIREIVGKFGSAAALAVEAGYEAVEIHSAHGYLPMAFMSPLWNRRDDSWGGDFDRRLRFALEVVGSIRSAVGASFPILYRLSSSEFMPGGLTIEDMERAVARLAAAGVDALDVSSGTLAGSLDMSIDPMSMREGWRFEHSRRIRAASGLPVIGIGPVRWPHTAEAALARGDADLIALGRPLLADPKWPRKVLGVNQSALRPCTNCNWCVDRAARHLPIGCAENPRTGAEATPLMRGFRKEARAVVVGGGPGGMFAALALSEAGYETVLFERHRRLGGGLIASAAPPLKEKLRWYLAYLEKKLDDSTIEVRRGEAASLDSVLALDPVFVAVATGAAASDLAIPGIGLPHVFSAYDLLMQDAEPAFAKDGPILVYGGGETGCETAEYLAARDFEVVLATRSLQSELARSAEAMYRKHLRERLARNPRIKVLDRTTLAAIQTDGVKLTHGEGDSTTLPIRTVVIAQGRRTGNPLADALRAHGVTVATVGDVERIARIGDAVHSAYAAVCSLAADNTRAGIIAEAREIAIP